MMTSTARALSTVELLQAILLHLPADSLLRCRAVDLSWKALVDRSIDRNTDFRRKLFIDPSATGAVVWKSVSRDDGSTQIVQQPLLDPSVVPDDYYDFRTHPEKYGTTGFSKIPVEINTAVARSYTDEITFCGYPGQAPAITAEWLVWRQLTGSVTLFLRFSTALPSNSAYRRMQLADPPAKEAELRYLELSVRIKKETGVSVDDVLAHMQLYERKFLKASGDTRKQKRNVLSRFLTSMGLKKGERITERPTDVVARIYVPKCIAPSEKTREMVKTLTKGDDEETAQSND